ncbi:MAG TPA: hydrogenase maturation nickel metallochaperone HypA [Candidatus Binataceae bacterium]
MHEYSVVGALIEQIEAQARARRAIAVRRVYVRIGDLSGVDRELLATAYELFRERTVCAAAALSIEPVSARWECGRCGCELPQQGTLRCGVCGGAPRLAQGDEILLTRIEMEVN